MFGRRYNWIDIGIALILGGIALVPVLHILAPGLDLIYFAVMPGGVLVVLGVLVLVIGGVIRLVRGPRAVEAPPRRIYVPPPQAPVAKRKL